MSSQQPRLDFDAEEPADPGEARDRHARALAVDPTRNVALEASAGTGKTRVLVDRYVALLLAGVQPRNILAVTFTRKAAAEMRQRILHELARRHRAQAIGAERWREIRDSFTDITIATIDAFCLALLREFPLEAEVDPGFELADETETPRFVDEALDRTLRAGRGIAADDPEMALLFAQLGEFQLRQGLAQLIDRRLVAASALNRFLAASRQNSIDDAVTALLGRLRVAFATVPGGAAGLIATGPDCAEFALFARDLRQLLAEPPPPAPIVQALLERVREHLLTQDGQPRKRLLYKKADFRSLSDYERHGAAVLAVGPYLLDAEAVYRRDINIVLARAVRRLFAIAQQEYGRTLLKNGVLDFTDVLQRTLHLLAQMDEFSRSRFKLEARYQHVLVDEFQDTSRAQWELVELLVRSWAEGLGLSERALQPTIFIVGDRKQSIYGFRDAEVAVLDEAARYIQALRPTGQVRTAITRSFRSVRELLAFVNDVFAAIDKSPERPDAFRYAEDDEFPTQAANESDADALAVVGARSDVAQAEAVAEEIAQLLARGVTVRDRDTGVRRRAAPGDIAVLFRTRESHRLFEDALARRHVPYYVYKGLGFFDADEIKDVLALLGFLAYPDAELRAAAFLRSRFVHLSDEALKLLAPNLSSAMRAAEPPAAWTQLHSSDRTRLALARAAVPGWLALVDRLPPSEVMDRVLAESAYAAEIGGPLYRQARENLKKIRALVRRIQNRGYATVSRIVDHFEQLVAGGDESNAIVDAIDAVNVMTVHAAKGLEFPIVFVVNMNRGSGGAPAPIRIAPAPVGTDEEPAVAIGEHQSRADEDADAKEAEESKRLLYVALTRARDRLYLCATVAADGRFVSGKGGLGRVLPASVAALFAAAANPSQPSLLWAGPASAHRLRAISGASETTVIAPPAQHTADRRDDLAPLESLASRPAAVTAVVSTADAPAGASAIDREIVSSTEIGVLVHRAVEAGLLNVMPQDEALPRALRALLRDDERGVIDVEAVVTQAAAALASLRSHHGVLRDADADPVVWRVHELPFSLVRPDGSIVRGTIDLLIERASGIIDVIELKTGQRQSEHQSQLDIYVEAARALFPAARVNGHLVYASPQEIRR
jgi:ATP-dependent helicase/nuclease subunit A